MTQPLHLLLIEDNPGDVTLIGEALREGKFTAELQSVPDGDSALRYLRREPPFENASRPDLILLDLRLPGRDGHDVLRELKSTPDFQGIPTLILTTSTDENDVQRAYNERANGYLVKPADVDQFLKAIQEFGHFWKNIAVLPRKVAARGLGA